MKRTAMSVHRVTALEKERRTIVVAEAEALRPGTHCGGGNQWWAINSVTVFVAVVSGQGGRSAFVRRCQLRHPAGVEVDVRVVVLTGPERIRWNPDTGSRSA